MHLGFVLERFLEAHPETMEERSDRIDLLNKTDPDRWHRSLAYKSTLISVKLPRVYYSTSSEGGRSYIQIIEPELKKGMSERELRLSLMKGLKVYCNCPDFGYGGFYYILNLSGSVFSSAEIKELTGEVSKLGFKPRYTPVKRPAVRNPKLRGIICKHLYSALQQIVKDHKTIFAHVSKKGL